MSTPYAAYAKTSQMVRKTKQVVMLYEGAIRAAQQARAAMEKGDVEARYHALTRACEIVTGLQLSLDFDKGGEVARLLYDYYAALDMRLMSLHRSQDATLCDLCIKHLKMMREAWEDVDRVTHRENVADDDPAALYRPELAGSLRQAAAGLSVTA